MKTLTTPYHQWADGSDHWVEFSLLLLALGVVLFAVGVWLAWRDRRRSQGHG